MAYDAPIVKEYSLLGQNVATAFSRNIRGPRGRRGRIRRLSLSATTAVTTGLIITVTTTVAPLTQTYGQAAFGAATQVLNVPVGAVAAPGGANFENATRDPNNFEYIIPADADVVFASTVGGATGVADIVLELAWF